MLGQPVGDVGRDQRQGQLDLRIPRPFAEAKGEPADADAEGDLTGDDEEEFAGRERQREMPDHDRGKRKAIEDQRRGIIGEPFALEDDQEPARHVEPARDRERRHHVGRRDDGSQQKGDGPGQADHVVRGGRHHRRGEDHRANREQHDRAQIVPELAPAHGDARGVDQRRQHHQEHQFRRQLDRRHARHEGQADAGQH